MLNESQESPWYQRRTNLLLIFLTIFTLGATAPALIASARKHHNVKFVYGVSVLTIIALPILPLVGAVLWIALTCYAFVRNEKGTDQNNTSRQSHEAVTPKLTTEPKSQSTRSDVKPEVDHSPDSSLLSESLSTTLDELNPHSTQTDTPRFNEPGFNIDQELAQDPLRSEDIKSLWSPKASKKRQAIERRFFQILNNSELVFAVASTNRVRGSLISFVVVTNTRIIALHHNERLNPEIEWATWSEMDPIEYTNKGLSAYGLICNLKNGKEMRLGSLTKGDLAEEFLKLARQFSSNPPDRVAEGQLQARTSLTPSPLNSDIQGADSNTQFGIRTSKHLPYNSDKRLSKGPLSYRFKWKKQIRTTKETFTRTASLYAAITDARQRHATLTANIDESQFQTKGDENVFESLGCVLIEVRKGAKVTYRESSYSGSSSGGSVRVGRVRVGGGSHGGTSSSSSISYPAPDQLTRIDSGKAAITSQRMTFAGSMFTKTTDFKKMADVTSNGRQILIAPKTGSKVWIVEFPTPEEAWIFTALIGAALSTPQRRLDETGESQYGSVYAEISANFRRTETEADLALQELAEELKILQEKWNEFRYMFPNKKLENLTIPAPRDANDQKETRLATVMLLSKPDGLDKSLELMKLIRSSTSLTLDQARKIVETAPSIVVQNIDPTLAEAIAHQLSDAGADIATRYEQHN